jgi:hypothetical protein
MFGVKRKSTVTGYQAITPFTLYRRDVEDVFAVVASVSTSVVMETDDYSDIKSVEELASTSPEGNRRVNAFHMIGSKRGIARIRVTVNERQGLVVLESDAPDLIGAQEKIKRIMWRHTDPIAFASLWPWLDAILIFSAGLSVFQGQVVLAVSLAVAAGVLGLLGSHLGRTRFTRVYLVDESQAPGLLRRNRDILLMLVGTALAVLVTLLIPMLQDAIK